MAKTAIGIGDGRPVAITIPSGDYISAIRHDLEFVALIGLSRATLDSAQKGTYDLGLPLSELAGLGMLQKVRLNPGQLIRSV